MQFELFSTCWACFHKVNEVSYGLHEFQWLLIGVFENYLPLQLASVVLVFIWSPFVVIPVSVLVVVVPVWEAIISLVKPVILLVPSVSINFPVEILSSLVVIRVPIVVSEI